MPRVLPVKPEEVLSVQREDRALVRRRVRENGGVGDGATGVTHLVDRQHIVPGEPQRFDHGQREVLVGEKASQGYADSSDSFDSIWTSMSDRCART